MSCHGMEKELSKDFSPSWANLLATLSVQRGVELTEKSLQRTTKDDNGKDCFHWPCFLRKLASRKVVVTHDHDVIERTNYADLPYNVRVNLLTLLLRQHIIIGHRELERFVKTVKSEVITSQHSWEDNLLGRLEELVAPMSPLPGVMNHTQKLTTVVHLSDNTIELIKREWLGELNKTTDGMAGSLLSWCSAVEKDDTVPIKRSHDHSDTSHNPPGKRAKTDQCEDHIISLPVLIDEHEEYITADDEEVPGTSLLMNDDNVDKEQTTTTKSKSLTDCLSLVTKVMEFCNQSTTLDGKEVEQLWEEFNSISADQMIQSLQIILVDKKSLLTEDSIINMLHFISAMPVTIGGRMGENLCAMTVLPYLLEMHQPASRNAVAAYSCAFKKQPTICIRSLIASTLQQNQFGSAHADLISGIIRGGDLGDHVTALWRLLVDVKSQACWNDHVISLAQTLLDAKVELDQSLLRDTLQTLLHVAGYMTGNLRFGKLLLALVSRHQAPMADHTEDLENLVEMISPAFMQRSLQLAVKKLQN
ncbi:uncharacterized protein [Dysidea avara]